MKRNNRVLCILFAAALLASVLTGCKNSNNDSSSDRNTSKSSSATPPQSETQQTEPETSGAAQEAVSGERIVTNGGEAVSLASLEHRDETSDAVVYFTSDISAQAMLDMYAALGVELTGDNIAVKLSTGEPPASNYLDPNLIADLVHQVDGTIVENNTAYGRGRKIRGGCFGRKYPLYQRDEPSVCRLRLQWKSVRLSNQEDKFPSFCHRRESGRTGHA